MAAVTHVLVRTAARTVVTATLWKKDLPLPRTFAQQLSALTEDTPAIKHGDQNIVSKCLMLIRIVPSKAPLYPKPCGHTHSYCPT